MGGESSHELGGEQQLLLTQLQSRDGEIQEIGAALANEEADRELETARAEAARCQGVLAEIQEEIARMLTCPITHRVIQGSSEDPLPPQTAASTSRQPSFAGPTGDTAAQ